MIAILLVPILFLALQYLEGILPRWRLGGPTMRSYAAGDKLLYMFLVVVMGFWCSKFFDATLPLDMIFLDAICACIVFCIVSWGIRFYFLYKKAKERSQGNGAVYLHDLRREREYFHELHELYEQGRQAERESRRAERALRKKESG